MATAQAPVVVGRERELERVLALFAPENGTAKLLLEGEPGIGKTTLWRAGVDEAQRRGFRVLEARPAAAESELSFAALGDLLGGLSNDIGGLPAPQRRALRIALLVDEAEGEPPEQRTIAVAVTEMLRRLSEDGPLLIAVDDTQWLDAPSAAALDFALRRLLHRAVRLLATARTDDGARVTFSDTERLAVGPLSPDELQVLVHVHLDVRLLRPVVRQLAEASGGNPFYALELAESLLRSGQTPEPGERLPIPKHLRAVIANRFEALSPRGRDAALATAALAQPTATAVAAVAGGTAAITEAVSTGVLERDGESLRFTHPLFAASIYDDAPPAERKAMHARLANVVADPEERARQFAEAADGPDAKIATFVEAAAARVASRGAPDAAVRLAKLAVVLTPLNRRTALHKRRLDCARYSLVAGDPHHAKTLLNQHLELAANGRERAEVELELGRTALVISGVSAATRRYENALREVDGSDELELQAMILTELADAHLDEMRTDSDASEKALALAEKVWNPRLLARALALHGLTLSERGEPPPDGYWERALEIERSTGELRDGGPAHAYGMVLFRRNEFAAAEQCLDHVADSMRRRGDPALPLVLLYLSDVTRASGAWDAAVAYADEAHDAARGAGRESLEPRCLLYKGRFAMLRGDLENARRHVASALAVVERFRSDHPDAISDALVPEGLARSLLGRIALLSGRPSEARECFAPDIATLRRLNCRELLVEALADDVSALISLGALEEASREVDEMQEITTTIDDQWLEGLVARSRGMVAAADRNIESALRHLIRSRDLLEHVPSLWPFELARTLLVLGSIQRRAREKAQARVTLTRALEIFEQLGAQLWAEQVRTELGQISGRPSRSGALTATEARVAEAVAAGRSNAEAAQELFMSPKTVEWNLSKVYKKLHVRSRAELAAKLAKERQS